MRRVLLPLFVLSVLLWPRDVAAEPITITTLSTLYTTRLESNWKNEATRERYSLTRTTTGADPIQDELFNLGQIEASATADFLSLGVYTASAFFVDGFVGQSSIATATANFEFAPLVDSLAPIGITGIASTFESYWSSGGVTLTDLTAGETLWSYAWTCCNFAGNMPWLSHAQGATGAYSLNMQQDTQLLSAHRYALSMTMSSNSNPKDIERLTLRVTGLTPDVDPLPEPVPEPATLTLMATGAVSIIAARRQRRRARLKS